MNEVLCKKHNDAMKLLWKGVMVVVQAYVHISFNDMAFLE